MPNAYHILVLEDDALDAELISYELQQCGPEFRSIRVGTESAFVEELLRARPDVVLSDYHLATIPGLEALRLTQHHCPGVPFIFVAGALGEEVVIKAFELGANDYVLKHQLHGLGPAIERALERSRSTALATLPGREALAQVDRDLPLFQCAVEQARESVLITTPQLDRPGPQIVYVNEAFTRMTGYASQEVLGKTPRLLQGPGTERAVLDRLRAQLSRGEPFEGETVNYRKDGSEFILQWEIVPLRGESGEVTHFVSIQRDVTERRRAEADRIAWARERAEQAAAKPLNELLDRVNDAFVWLDRDGRYTFVNRKAASLLGRTPEELLGREVRAGAPEGAQPPFLRAYEAAVTEQRPILTEEFFEPSNRWFEHRVHFSPDGVAVFFEDVTERRRAGNELKASMERFELAARATRDVIYDWNIPEQRIWWNENFQSVFVYKPEEVGAGIEAWEARIHPADQERVLSSLNAALRTRTDLWQEQYQVRCGDGSYRHVLDRGYVMRDPAGRVLRMVGAMMDITPSRNEAEALAEMNRRVTNILESITDAFFAIDREWRFSYVNQQAEELLQRPRSELLGQRLWEKFPKAADTRFYEEVHRAVQQNKRVRFETFYPPVEKWLSVAAYPGADGLSVYFHDVTERKQAEQALHRSEERFRMIIEHARDYAIYMLDPEGRVATWNSGAERLDGYGMDEILGLHFSIFFRPEDQAAGIPATLLETARTGGRVEEEAWRVRKDGASYWASTALSALHDKDGVLCGFSEIARDMTGEKRAREEIEALNEQLEHRVQKRTAELEEANKELEAFNYSVSHDLRAPLRHIGGYVALLNETAAGKLDAQERRYFQTISDATSRMGLLIDDLLSFARMLRADMVHATFPLQRVVEEAIAALQPEARGRAVEWKFGPLATVQGDPSLLRQAMINLLSNALKYTRTRAVARIEIESRAEGDEIVVSIRDNGVGFDMKYVGKLFGVFHRLHPESEFEGTGIGLANVRRIIQRHNGKTWAEGKPGEGATFYFSLPSPRDTP